LILAPPQGVGCIWPVQGVGCIPPIFRAAAPAPVRHLALLHLQTTTRLHAHAPAHAHLHASARLPACACTRAPVNSHLRTRACASTPACTHLHASTRPAMRARRSSGTPTTATGSSRRPGTRRSRCECRPLPVGAWPPCCLICAARPTLLNLCCMARAAWLPAVLPKHRLGHARAQERTGAVQTPGARVRRDLLCVAPSTHAHAGL